MLTAQWDSDHAKAFTEIEQDFRTGDRLQFTRNNCRAKRLNGNTTMVVAIDAAEPSALVQKDDGERQMLDLRPLPPTTFATAGFAHRSAQGATATYVIAHLEAFRANTVDTRSAYIPISRTTSHFNRAPAIFCVSTSSAASLHKFRRDDIGEPDQIISTVEGDAGLVCLFRPNMQDHRLRGRALANLLGSVIV